MSEERYDLAIMGGGPGGYAAAVMAARHGLKVVLFEAKRLGGTCLNVGCIPTKYLLHKAALIAEIRQQTAAGVFKDAGLFSWKKVIAGKDEVVRKLTHGIDGLLASHQVQVVNAAATLTAPGEVTAANRTYKVKDVIIATGSANASLPVPGSAGADILDSTALLQLERVPASLTIIGGGVIGLEFASIFAAVGSKVTVVEMLNALLPGEDREAVGVLERELKRAKITFQLGRAVKGISGTMVTLADGTTITAEKILVAIGRQPVLAGIDAAKLGLRLTKPGHLQVDSHQETNLPHVYAIGDVAGGWQLAHAAYAEAEIAMAQILGKPCAVQLELMPRCIYSLPQLAAVGLTEEQVRERQIAYQRGVFPLAASGKALADEAGTGMIKVLSAASDGRILGVHAVGAQAAEWLAPALTLMNMKGTVADLATMIFPHPTCSEAFKEAALAGENASLHLPRPAKGARSC
jgi:dihydrolipoamide dehydrogenase